jgi:UDP-3-O-[3-hydroxymyristoyl] glucosamine N-acyltransferase
MESAETIRAWPVVDGWYTSPDDYKVKIGDRTVIGEGTRIGNGVVIGHRVVIGDDVIIKEGAVIDNDTSIGSRAVIGEDAIINADANIGIGASLGEGTNIGYRAVISSGTRIAAGAKLLIYLGVEPVRGFPRSIFLMPDGSLMFNAGCRTLNLGAARTYWGSPNYPDRKRGQAYLRLIDYAETEAMALLNK